MLVHCHYTWVKCLFLKLMRGKKKKTNTKTQPTNQKKNPQKTQSKQTNKQKIPCLLKAQTLVECSAFDNKLALRKWRLSASGKQRNQEGIVFLLIVTVVHFLSALWAVYFSCSVSFPSRLSCLSCYKDW